MSKRYSPDADKREAEGKIEIRKALPPRDLKINWYIYAPALFKWLQMPKESKRRGIRKGEQKRWIEDDFEMMAPEPQEFEIVKDESSLPVVSSSLRIAGIGNAVEPNYIQVQYGEAVLSLIDWKKSIKSVKPGKDDINPDKNILIGPFQGPDMAYRALMELEANPKGFRKSGGRVSKNG